MRKVYIAAFGSGMGHATRMSLVAEALREAGFEVAFSSSGEVTSWLRAKGYRCNDIPLVDVAYDETGAFSSSATARNAPSIVSGFDRQVACELRNIMTYSPEVVLSDSMFSTVVAARLLGVRAIVVLNQLRLFPSPRTPRVLSELISSGSVLLGDLLWGYCESVVVPDLPPPYTISERNLWNAGSSSARAKYVGFLTPRNRVAPDALTEKLRKVDRTKVFWQVSGPPATRGPFLAKALALSKLLGDKYLFVVATGNPRGSTEPRAIPGGFMYEWCPSPGPLLEMCSSVVSRAGHVSVSDYVMRAKPSLLVPIPSQTEQVGNATKAEKLGVAIKVEEEDLDVTAVEESLASLSEGKYLDRAKEMSEVAKGFDARSSVVRCVGH